MIKITLLHPVQETPVRSWTFDGEQLIKIGRSPDNHVVIYSSVVSRYHAEIKIIDDVWLAFNLGTNGTYVNGKPITQAKMEDGLILHLARSGPRLQINMESKNPIARLVRSSLFHEEESRNKLHANLKNVAISDDDDDDNETTAIDFKKKS